MKVIRLPALCRALAFYLSFCSVVHPAETPQALFDRAVADFKAGRIAAAASGFDRVAEMVPGHAPQLWQRGIALYYAGRFRDCRAQFESHKTVNPNDVENAAWHFLCVAAAESPEKARAALLSVGADPRVPMGEAYQMFRGETTPDQVLSAAGERAESRFYGHLYVGLYFEALGQGDRALGHIKIAAADQYAAMGYMHTVARVHLADRNTKAANRKTRPPQPQTWTFDRLNNLGGHATNIVGEPKVIDTPLGKAVEFDGVNDAIFVDVHPLAGAETFTWEVIFRPSSGGQPEQRFFHLQERDSNTGADTQTRLLLETRIIDGQWCLDSFASTSTGSKALIDRTKLHPLDRWHHVAMVYDGTEFRHYVNGKLQGKAQVRLSRQGQGHSSVGVRINLRDYFKGAIRVARMTPRALEEREFLPVPRP